MKDVQHYPSPDGRYDIVIGMMEMRMSHWVSSAALWQNDPRQLLLELGESMWSTDTVSWSDDSRRVRVSMRRYPGDSLPILLDLKIDEQVAVPHEPADPTPIPFTALNAFLDDFYQRNRTS